MIHIKRLDEMVNQNDEVRFANPENQMRFERFKEMCEDDGWKLDVSIQRGEACIEVSKYSDAGQDFSFIIWAKPEDTDDIYFHLLVDDYAEGYEVDDEAKIWCEGTGEYDDYGNEILVGKNGAPHDYEDVVADMQSCLDNMKSLAFNLKKENI